MWRKKPRTWGTVEEVAKWRLDHRYDYVVENPLDGHLWQLPCTQRLLERSDKDEPCGLIAKLMRTSYCHYESDSQKRTGFLTTLVEVQLEAPCPSNPCGADKHTPWESLGTRERNSIPQSLIHQFLVAWMAKTPTNKKLVLIDVFAGFGSVETAVGWSNAHSERQIHICSNDILKRRDALYDFDMEKFDLTVLESFALMRGGWSRENTSVLLWMSTPCTTYSIAGLFKHRPKEGSISELAASHDKMNDALFTQLYTRCHIDTRRRNTNAVDTHSNIINPYRTKKNSPYFPMAVKSLRPNLFC